MRSRFFAFGPVAFLLFALGTAAGQYVTLTDTNVTNVAGVKVASGTISICPVTSAGAPLAFKIGAGGGTVIAACASATVTNGAFTVSVPDTYLANPQNACLKLSLQDPVTYLEDLPNFGCVQPSNQSASAAVAAGWCTAGGVCDLDLYTPPIAALPTQEVSGGEGATFNGGNVTGTTTFQASTTVDADGGPNAVAILSVRQLHTPSASGGRAVPIDQLCPNIASGYGCGSRVGVDGATNDFASLIFNYFGPGSTANSVDLGFPLQNGGAGGVLPMRIWASGHISIGNTVDPGELLGVGSSNQFWVDLSGNVSAHTVLLSADPTANLQAATKQYVDNHIPNLSAPGPIGGTTPAAATFTTVTTTGPAPGGFTATANGSSPTAAPANSVTYGVPSAVPTPYVFLPPTNVTSATSQTPMQCTYSAGPPAVLTCTLAAISGSGLTGGLSTGVDHGTYSTLSWNGVYGTGNFGIEADASAADGSIYYDALAADSGRHIFRIGGTQVFATPLTAPGSTAQIPSCSTSAGVVTCTWSSPSGIGNGISTGVNSGNYTCLTWSGSCSNASAIGIIADDTSTDKSLYAVAATGGQLRGKIGGVDAYHFSTASHTAGASCSGSYFTFYTGDGYETWCNGSTEQVVAHP